MNCLQKFEYFMDSFRIPYGQPTTDATHTAMGNIYKKKGTFIIPNEKEELFFIEYEKVVFDLNIPMYITERPLSKKGILKFDLDFKYESEHTERLFGPQVVYNIVHLIQEYLKEYVEKNSDKTFYSYVFQRPSPYRKDKTVKDGIHIMYPHCSLSYDFQYFLRSKLIDGMEKIQLHNFIPFTNTLFDVVDESIIEKNGWLMYGSTKEGILPYKLTNIFDENMNVIQNKMTDKELFRLLSIRRDIPENNVIREDWIEYMQKFDVKKKKKEGEKSEIKNDKIFDNISKLEWDYDNIPDRNHIEKLVGIISYDRATDYNAWVEMGMCLHNIGNLYELWVCFSKQDFEPIISRLNDLIDKERQKLDYDEDIIKNLENDLSDWEDIISSKKDLKNVQRMIQEKYIFDENVFLKNSKAKWNSFIKKSDGLNVGSIIFWAKKDNPKLFKNIRFHKVRDMIEDAVFNSSHGKISAVLYTIYKHQYVCSDYEKGIWYEWKNHSWVRMDGVQTIRRKITGTTNDNDNLVTLFTKVKNMVIYEKLENNKELLEYKIRLEKLEHKINPAVNTLNDIKKKLGLNATIPETEESIRNWRKEHKEIKDEYDKLYKELKKTYVRPYEDTICKFLQTSSSIDNIVKEAKQEFYDKDFNRRLNTNMMLFLFNNGVFDLENMIFREGRPDDYLSLESDIPQINYMDCGDIRTNQDILDIEKYFENVIVDKDKRDFFLTLIASCLEGGNNNNIFAILTGSGSNAKSLTMNFIEDTFGMYAGKLSPAFLTQKRNKSSSASPEYHGIIDCRIVSSEESDTTDELNTAIIKEITGNSKISSRTLYQSKMTTKTPQFTPFLICNDLPTVKSLDGGTWRRIVVISFDSKFVDNPDDPKWVHLSNVFKVDRTLKIKMERWKEPFIYLLIHKYYKIFKENNKNIICPECVKAFTDKFKDENDIYQPFIESFIEITNNKLDTVRIKDLYQKILSWFRENHQGEKEPSQQIIKKYFENKFGAYDSKGWVGKKLID